MYLKHGNYLGIAPKGVKYSVRRKISNGLNNHGCKSVVKMENNLILALLPASRQAGFLPESCKNPARLPLAWTKSLKMALT